jgi:FkbM family methyltransferase
MEHINIETIKNVEELDIENTECFENKMGKFHIFKNDQWIGETLSRGDVWNPNILDIIFQHISKNKNIIDVGAHIGTHTIPYANFIDKNMKVYSFEAQKPIYSLLLKNIEENNVNNVIAHNYAIGHVNNIDVTLTNKVLDGKSKNHTLEYNTDKKINYGGITLGIGGEKITMRTLDSFQLDNISFIKIDVEGCEKMVLYGARELIKTNKPYILFETKKDISKEMKKIMNIPKEVLEFDIFKYCKSLNYIGVNPIKTNNNYNDFLLIPPSN